VPFLVRHRVRTALIALIALALVGGGVAWLASRAHHGAGKLSIGPPKAQPKAKPLAQVELCTSCAQGYNPLGSPTYERPEAPLAIDNDLSTYWSTQQYYDRKLDKAGTGLYVDARPGITGRALRIVTNTPGFTVTIYGANSTPTYTWPNPAWTPVSAPTTIAARAPSSQSVSLTSGGKRYRYWLVWITNLGSNESVELNEVALYH
jgi:serine/threonine-protein kinase